MSQATSTFWDDRVERVEKSERAAAVRKANPEVKRRVRSRRFTDAIIFTIILAAAATCFSVYSRARSELGAVLTRHDAAGERVKDLTIKVQKLERDLEQLRTDSRVIELFARQKFGYVRNGDVVIKLAQASNTVGANNQDLAPVESVSNERANIVSTQQTNTIKQASSVKTGIQVDVKTGIRANSRQISSVKQAGSSKQVTTSKQSTASKQAVASRSATTSRQATASRQAVASKQATTSKQAIASKQATTSRQATTAKQATTSKQTTSVKQARLTARSGDGYTDASN